MFEHFDTEAEATTVRPHRVTLSDGQVLQADTTTELVDALLPVDYLALDDVAALEARVDFAEEHAATVQSLLLLGLAADEGLESLGEDDRLFLTTGKSEPVSGEYDGPIDLIQVTTTYEPYSDDEPPTGRIIWIDPSTETSLLTTLGAASEFSYTTAE
ncbi:hypothetical protein [Pseudoclavibacter soli]|uniref:hypothetical protein n=1 Tax=Pseudoclavibacter soli TaxID=452623 RepID=UPI00041D9E61|nr:hypothetical protein [Pseudoclavibacter soli]